MTSRQEIAAYLLNSRLSWLMANILWELTPHLSTQYIGHSRNVEFSRLPVPRFLDSLVCGVSRSVLRVLVEARRLLYYLVPSTQLHFAVQRLVGGERAHCRDAQSGWT